MRSHTFLRAVPLALLLAAASTGAARATDYTLDPLRSTLLLRVWKEGTASAFAHDHVVRASRFTGTVRYDASKPQASSVDVEATTKDLVCDEPTYRRRFDLPLINEQSRREIQHTMESSKQLDVAAFPAITFRSTKVSGTAGALEVTGALTIHGQTREITFPATVGLVQGLLRGRATLRFRQSDFGITPYSFGTAVRNKDEVEMHLELIASPAAAATR
jgi:polyisoprenoid-binding protein YceI